MQKLHGLADEAIVTDDEAVFVEHAGIVLLHPFYPRLFEKLGLVENKAFVDDWSRSRAVVLLHFIASGSDRQPEYALTLPKLLCGVPANRPLDRAIEINH